VIPVPGPSGAAVENGLVVLFMIASSLRLAGIEDACGLYDAIVTEISRMLTLLSVDE
jgi:hypothetical protein